MWSKSGGAEWASRSKFSKNHYPLLPAVTLYYCRKGMERAAWNDSDERALVVAAKAGDIRAFDVLAIRYRRAAVLAALRIVKRHEIAEDAVQDALLTAFKALPGLQDDDRFAGWLGAIVRHRALRHLSKESRPEEPISNHIDRLILRQAPGISASSEDEELPVLDELPEDLQQIARLYYVLEWPVAKIADFLSLPVTTVKWRLSESRRRLRRRLAGKWEL